MYNILRNKVMIIEVEFVNFVELWVKVVKGYLVNIGGLEMIWVFLLNS